MKEEKERKKKVKVELDEFYYHCSDGCCTHWGMTTKVDGKEMQFDNLDSETIVRQVLEELGYEVEIISTFNGEG